MNSPAEARAEIARSLPEVERDLAEWLSTCKTDEERHEMLAVMDEALAALSATVARLRAKVQGDPLAALRRPQP